MSRNESTRGGAAAGIAMAIALLALVIAGFALLGGGSSQEAAAAAEEVRLLRMEVDSLRAAVNGVVDPFGPTAPAPSPSPGQDTLTIQPPTTP